MESSSWQLRILQVRKLANHSYIYVRLEDNRLTILNGLDGIQIGTHRVNCI